MDNEFDVLKTHKVIKTGKFLGKVALVDSDGNVVNESGYSCDLV